MSIANDLRRHVRGRVQVAGDAGFEQAGRPWNLAVEQPVLAVVEAADTHDVAALVRYAGGAGLTVATQPSGHGASGDVAGVILLRTGRLDELAVRPEQRVARVGAGVRWGRAQAEAGRHGLTGLAGSSPEVSVVGYTLGGGLSWFGRKHGFAAGGVRAFEVVDADGTQATITEETDHELFWALRGGGGDFAVVTALEYDLHPAPQLFGGRMVWPAERAPQLLETFREITARAPDELTVWLSLLRPADRPPVVTVDATYLGDESDGRSLLRGFERVDGLLVDGRRRLRVAELGEITSDPTDPGASVFRAELLTDLDDTAAKTLLAAPIDPLVGMQLRHLGGRLARPSETPAGHLAEPYLLSMVGIPTTPPVELAVRARQREIVAALGPYVSGRKPFTQLAPEEPAALAFPEDTLDGLRAIKQRRDPRGVLRSNHPVNPIGLP
ncbi:FAD-binding oxidoreductase [Solihabitans fulvus]|uniref:FAD-binding oxidoreductase n=1 Tax=Solihabitans fulvus TaxID=1892852 RepID=A0A5B2XW31_9PSEU|nr:FAD-binding oxidoreductase [Solihabitans fulvus]KAA2267092.1 FAD-binding oxidoreductase [Solihabitans fulvus]